MRDIRSFIFIAPLASLLALAGAYTAEYGFGLKPCQLCLYQRIPYAAVTVISLLTIIWINFSGKNLYKKTLLISGAAIFALIFAVGAVLAFYHAGVEWGWFEGPGCAATGNAETAEEMLKAILNAALVSCKDPAFIFMGLSMAGWNVLFSGSLAAFYIWYLNRIKKYGR